MSNERMRAVLEAPEESDSLPDASLHAFFKAHVPVLVARELRGLLQDNPAKTRTQNRTKG
jgi:hypothetical protein